MTPLFSKDCLDANSPYSPCSCRARVLFGLAVAWVQPVAQAAQATVEQADVRSYDIAAGSLDSVLGQFGQQAGVMVAVDSQLSNGLNSPGLRGQFALDQALAQLIAGTGLQPVTVAPGRYRLIAQVSSTGAMELGATSISAAGLGATTEGTGSYTTGSTSTATKLNLSIRETPQTISVITRQRMDDQQLHSMSEVLNQTPGVTMSPGRRRALQHLLARQRDQYLSVRRRHHLPGKPDP